MAKVHKYRITECILNKQQIEIKCETKVNVAQVKILYQIDQSWLTRHISRLFSLVMANYYYYNRFMAFCPGLPMWAGIRRNISHYPTFIHLYRLLPSTTIHNILPVQFTCLAMFLHNLCPSPLWSTSWTGALRLILHTFLYPISVFCKCKNSLPWAV